jgi:acetyl esterase/lipase
VLGYPVISFIDGYYPGAFVGSVDNFFGRRDPDEALRRQFSNELHVEAGHPPVFIWTTRDDAAGVPVEFTLYPRGPHGMGLALDAPNEARGWTALLLAWLARYLPLPESKLRAVREALTYSHPTGDIGELNRDIERGHADAQPFDTTPGVNRRA